MVGQAPWTLVDKADQPKPWKSRGSLTSPGQSVGFALCENEFADRLHCLA